MKIKFTEEFINKLESKDQEIFCDTETFRYNSRDEIGANLLEFALFFGLGLYFTVFSTSTKFILVLGVLTLSYGLHKILEIFLYKVTVDFTARKIIYRVYKKREISLDEIASCSLENEIISVKGRGISPHFFITMRNSKNYQIYLYMSLEKKQKLILMFRQNLKEKFSIDGSFYNENIKSKKIKK